MFLLIKNENDVLYACAEKKLFQLLRIVRQIYLTLRI